MATGARLPKCPRKVSLPTRRVHPRLDHRKVHTAEFEFVGWPRRQASTTTGRRGLATVEHAAGPQTARAPGRRRVAIWTTIAHRHQLGTRRAVSRPGSRRCGTDDPGGTSRPARSARPEVGAARDLLDAHPSTTWPSGGRGRRRRPRPPRAERSASTVRSPRRETETMTWPPSRQFVAASLGGLARTMVPTEVPPRCRTGIPMTRHAGPLRAGGDCDCIFRDPSMRVATLMGRVDASPTRSATQMEGIGGRCNRSPLRLSGPRGASCEFRCGNVGGNFGWTMCVQPPDRPARTARGGHVIVCFWRRGAPTSKRCVERRGGRGRRRRPRPRLARVVEDGRRHIAPRAHSATG